MKCLLAMFPLFVIVVALIATAGCGDGSPAPQQPPAPNTHWRGEDTGYRSDEAARAATPADQPAGRR